MSVNSKRLTCAENARCEAGSRCLHDHRFTRNDMKWREFCRCDSVLDEVTYESLVLDVQQEHEIDIDSVLRVAKDVIDQRLQDFWYLVNLNVDQLIEEASKGR